MSKTPGKGAGKELTDGLNPNILAEKLSELKKLVPEAFAEGKLDPEKLVSLFGAEAQAADEEGERYRFEWAGKKEVFAEIGKRSACTLTLDAKRSSKDWEKSEHVFIEGENLEVLRTLQKAYFGKVKMIYIDPPYNTGNDFVYNDNFTQSESEYCKDACDVTEDGHLARAFRQNTKDSGRYHSKWLSMMYPRLYLAHNLLRDDGVIFVSIDDNEVHNLRMIMNEIFGEENYLNAFCWVNNLKGRQISGSGAAKTYEHVLVYAKRIENVSSFELSIEKLKALMPSSYKGFDYETESDKDGDFVVKNELYNTNSIFNEETRPNLVFNIHYNFKTKEVKFSDAKDSTEFVGFTKISPKKNNDGVHKFHAWRWSKEKIVNELTDLKFVQTNDGAKIFTKIREYLNTILKDIITDITTPNGAGDLKDLFGDAKYFDYPKPIDLVKIFVNQMDTEGLALDFFAGSGTTAHAVMAQNAEDGGNRKYICVQLPEETPESSEARKAGYKRISDIAIERIKRAAKKIKEEKPDYTGDLGVRVYTATDSHFPQWHARAFQSDKELEEGMLNHIKKPVKSDEYARATEVLLKLGYPLTTPTEEKDGWLFADGKIALVLDEHFPAKQLMKILDAKPMIVVVLERVFKNDNEKINFELRCGEAGVVFQAV